MHVARVLRRTQPRTQRVTGAGVANATVACGRARPPSVPSRLAASAAWAPWPESTPVRPRATAGRHTDFASAVTQAKPAIALARLRAVELKLPKWSPVSRAHHAGQAQSGRGITQDIGGHAAAPDRHVVAREGRAGGHASRVGHCAVVSSDVHARDARGAAFGMRSPLPSLSVGQPNRTKSHCAVSLLVGMRDLPLPCDDTDGLLCAKEIGFQLLLRPNVVKKRRLRAPPAST